MLNCNIIYKDVEYTPAEFKDLVLSEGLGSLLGDSPSQLATAIADKYDVSRAEESLTEMWTRLELEKKGIEVNAVTKAQVKEELQAKGQLTDYDTQEQIRANTYSGVQLTGIAASFGKTLGYTFEAEPITYIKHGEVILPVNSMEFRDMLKDRGLSEDTTAETFVAKYPEFTVYERSLPTFTDSHHFRIDGQLLDGFSRTEKQFFPNQKENINIFETVDTIINLAIDNVKKGLLHVLGITNSNANLFLNMLAMGVPLNIVSKVFKTPIVTQLNEIGRLTEDKVNKTVLNNTMEFILSNSNEDLTTALTDYTGSEKKAKSILINLRNSTDPARVLSRLDINTKILDDVYTEKAEPLIKALSDAAVLQTLKKIIPIGEQMFDYSQAFSLLRGIPNKKWKLDSIIQRIEKYHNFDSEVQSNKSVKQVFTDTIAKTFRLDDEYKNALLESEEAAEKLLNQKVNSAWDDKFLFGTMKADIRANYVNRVIRRTISRNFSPINSVFKNNAVLRLPHVMSAYRAALQTNSLLESIFPVFSPVVKDFVVNLIDEVNIFKGESVGQQVELVSKELLKFLGSDLSFTLGGATIDLSVPPDYTYTTSSRTYFGKEAWAQEFIGKMNKVANSEEALDNDFLKSLEPDQLADGSKTLRIIGDKVNDEEALELIREGFAIFAKEQPAMARDLFKYSLMVEGMYYEKTGFALVFPTQWSVKYGVALDSRLDTMIPNNNPLTDINLVILKNKFIFQLVRNNPSLIGFPRGTRAVDQRTTKVANKDVKSFAGSEDYNGGKVHFDLKLARPFDEKAEKFIRRYNEDIYLLIPTPGAQSTYYVKVTEKSGHRFYDLDIQDLETSIDFDIISSGKYPVINASKIINGRLQLDAKEHLLKDGDTFLAFDKSSAALKFVRLYKVKTTASSGGKNTYTLEFKEEISLLKEDLQRALRTDLARFVTTRLGTTKVIDTLQDYKAIVRKNKNTAIIVNETEDREAAIVLPIKPIPIGLSRADEEAIVRNIGEAISKLDTKLNYYISSNILTPLLSNPSVYKTVSNMLKDKIGFKDTSPNKNLGEDNLLQDVYLSLKRMDLIKRDVKKGTTITEVEGEKYTHTIELKKKFNTVKPGDLLYAGADVYFFVDDVTDTLLKVTHFTGQTFAAIEQDNLTRSEFESIYAKTIRC